MADGTPASRLAALRAADGFTARAEVMAALRNLAAGRPDGREKAAVGALPTVGRIKEWLAENF